MEDIARSVRNAFASERLQNSWRLLSSPERSDREAALGGIERLLARHDLTMEHILHAILEMPADPYPKVGEQISMNLQSPIVEQEFPVHVSRTSETCETPLKVLSGKSIPHQIGGRVSLKSEKVTRRGEEIVVAIVGSDVRYEPLKAKDEAVITILRQAAEKRMLTQIQVNTVRDNRRIPVIVRAGMGIGF